MLLTKPQSYRRCGGGSTSGRSGLGFRLEALRRRLDERQVHLDVSALKLLV